MSQFTANLTADLGIPAARIDVIHNGADGNRFRPDPSAGKAFRDRHDLGKGPLILTVGNVTARKGQHQVVTALPRVLESVAARYVVVGRPTEGDALGDALVNQARSLGVDHAVKILGQLSADEVAQAHQAADVFAMTSTATPSGDVEGYGIAVVEAALSGVPAVVTRGTGAEEAVEHRVTGLAVEPNPNAIAEALSSLLIDEGRLHDMGGPNGTRSRRAQMHSSRALSPSTAGRPAARLRNGWLLPMRCSCPVAPKAPQRQWPRHRPTDVFRSPTGFPAWDRPSLKLEAQLL